MEHKCKKTDVKSIEKCDAEQTINELETQTKYAKFIESTGVLLSTKCAQFCLDHVQYYEQRIKELTAKITEWEKECDLRGDMWCRLNEENKKLTEENASLNASCTELERKCASLNDENERLRAENKALVNENAELKNKIQEADFTEEDIELIDEYAKLLNEGIREATICRVQKFAKMMKAEFADDSIHGQSEIYLVVDHCANKVLGENE